MCGIHDAPGTADVASDAPGTARGAAQRKGGGLPARTPYLYSAGLRLVRAPPPLLGGWGEARGRAGAPRARAPRAPFPARPGGDGGPLGLSHSRARLVAGAGETGPSCTVSAGGLQDTLTARRSRRAAQGIVAKSRTAPPWMRAPWQLESWELSALGHRRLHRRSSMEMAPGPTAVQTTGV